jgi:hypothetical protein
MYTLLFYYASINLIKKKKKTLSRNLIKTLKNLLLINLKNPIMRQKDIAMIINNKK